MSSIKKEILNRFTLIYVIMLALMIPVVYKMYDTMVTEGDFWRNLGTQQSKMNVKNANRGNILSCDGKLLVTSIPSYVLHMDLRADGMTPALFDSCLPMLADSLGNFYNVSPSVIKSHLRTGYNMGARYYKISNQKISYVDLKRVKTFPLFNLGKNVGGLDPRPQVSRKFPFGSTCMCSRTIGGLYAEIGKGGKSGLEHRFDSVLRGVPGLTQELYVGSRKHEVFIEEPIEGKDVMTTMDVNIMDITDNALRKTLSRVEAEKGCAVVMEVATGQIKAMSNLKRDAAGNYVEGENYAVSSQTEPGSTFKIASSIVALENGIDTSKIVDTGDGVWHIYGRDMKDWNHHRAGQNGKISLNRGIQVSSNIVIAKIIEDKFNKEPMKYVEALYKMGLNTPLSIELNGVAEPRIKNVNDPTWSKTTLPWMAHGYEINIPPINLLTFYNGLANNGKMIQPTLLKGIYYNGKELQRNDKINVINEKLCSQVTLDKVRRMMIDVVEKGTAKNVHSDHFLIAGKTGTAVQKVGGQRKHQLTFCGYFPADDPKYSMIVVVWYPNTQKYYPSAGGISGEVFKNVAERIYAQSPLTRTYLTDITRSTDEQFYPASKDGNYKDLSFLLDKLGLKYRTDKKMTSGWCRSYSSKTGIDLANQNVRDGIVPNVVGMGAKDAVFLMENRGLKVKLSGVGTVYSQSIPPGGAAIKGNLVVLNLK